jgi:hypothetical protein
LGLIAQEQGKTWGGFDEAMEALGEEVVAVLGLDDLMILVDEVWADTGEGPTVVGEDLIEAGSEHAGMKALGAEEGLLGERDALDGEEFLGVDGLIGGDGVFAEAGDFVDLFEADDGEGGGGESVFAGVLGGAGLALRGAGSGGEGGVGAIGGELFFGYGFLGAWHRVLPL